MAIPKQQVQSASFLYNAWMFQLKLQVHVQLQRDGRSQVQLTLSLLCLQGWKCATISNGNTSKGMVLLGILVQSASFLPGAGELHLYTTGNAKYCRSPPTFVLLISSLCTAGKLQLYTLSLYVLHKREKKRFYRFSMISNPNLSSGGQVIWPSSVTQLSYWMMFV